MSSKPKVSINIPNHIVDEVRGKMAALIATLLDLGAEAANQSQLYRAMAYGEIIEDGDTLYVRFPVGKKVASDEQ
jgi:hypothetical protein